MEQRERESFGDNNLSFISATRCVHDNVIARLFLCNHVAVYGTACALAIRIWETLLPIAKDSSPSLELAVSRSYYCYLTLGLFADG